MSFGSRFSPLGPGNWPSLVNNLQGFNPLGLPIQTTGTGASGANYDYSFADKAFSGKGKELALNPLDQPEANSYVNGNYYIDQTKRIEFDTTVSQLVWINSTECLGDHGKNTLYHIQSWGALNAYLKSPEGRVKYGNDHDTTRLLADWKFLGCQVTVPVRNASNGANETFHIAKRSRIGNYWSVDPNKTIIDCDRLFATYNRYILDDDYQIYKKLKNKENKENIDPRKLQVPNTYWRIDPISCRGGADPSMLTWTSFNSKNRYVGYPQHIGNVIKVLTKNGANTTGMSSQAQLAVYPDRCSYESIQAYSSLQHLEIMIRDG